MRPRSLEIEGFSTFRQRTRLDFDGLDLVAFTGATGAGKSTLIDAITFALYGSVARYDNANRVAPVIHQLSNQARVRLDFEAGGRTYIATRVVRRINSKGGDGDAASTREARLELVDPVDPAAETTVLAGDVKSLNTAVEEILGLDFRQFTRTIVLPQGDFAAFLRDEPSNRDKLLQRLLDIGIYERMGQLARSQAKKSANQAEALIQHQQQLKPLSDEEFERLVDRVETLEHLRSDIEASLAELAALDARLDPLRREVQAIDQAVARLASIEIPDDLAELDRELTDADRARQAVEGELVAARAARDDAMAARDALPDKGALVRAQSLREQLAEAAERLDDQRKLATDAEELARRLAVEQDALDTALREAEAALRTARLAADAADWTAALVTGEPCPVCHRRVEAIPDHDAAKEMEAAAEAHDRLGRESRSVASRLAKASATAQSAAEEIERQTERIDLLQLALSTHDGPTDPDTLAGQLDAVDAAEGLYRSAAAAVGALETRLQEAVDIESGLRAALRTIQTDLSVLRDSVADLEPPALGHRSLSDVFGLLARWAEERATVLGETRTGLAEEGKQVANKRGDLLAELNRLAESNRLGGEPLELATTATEALADAKAARATAEQRRTDHERTEARIAELEAERILNEALGRHLRSGGFGSWLLTEALDNIVAKATVWLLQLSNNQYSLLAGDRHFAIIDHNNANESRDVRTLSGGETFLASLALALALADSIAELAPVDAPRLESMFLDEGFGTLDPGTLDVVAGAIEELASTGRMIGIVTHVNDLAERMPARFEITKGPSTSTVELVEA